MEWIAMAVWSISRMAIAAALVSVTAIPALAQQGWAPPQQGDGAYRSDQDDGYGQPRYDDAAPYARDDADSGADHDYSPPSSYGQDTGDGDDRPTQPDSGGGFDSRDAMPPSGENRVPAPRDEADGWGTWRSSAPSSDTGTPESGISPPPASSYPDSAETDSLDARPEQVPGTINSFNQPDPSPGVALTTGINDRSQAVSSCLAAVRSRVGGGAGASRVDGINGEWMVSGAIADGRAFYCSIHHGSIDDVQFGG